MKLKSNQIILSILIFGIFISGCVQNEPNEVNGNSEPIIENTEVVSPTEIVETLEEPTSESTQAPLPTASVEFIEYYYSTFEDFDDWAIFPKYDQDLYGIEVSEHGLILTLAEGDDFLAYSNVYGSNTIIETKFSVLEGSGPIKFQLICRSTEEGEYLFEIDSSGFWEIGNFNFISQSFESISNGSFVFDTSDERGNLVIVECNQDDLLLQINDELVAQVSDQSYSEGYVGFNLINESINKNKIKIDYFFVSAP